MDKKKFLISALRRASYRWPPRSIAMSRARVGYGIYQCEQCQGLLLTNEKKLDHIEPVVDPALGFTTWDSYIDRLFVNETGFQVLCWVCHNEKTGEERDVRTERRRKARRI